MTNYTDTTENGIDTERTCARCETTAMKGTRFCADHGIVTDGGEDDVVIDAILQTHYTYLGQDAEGFHHHYNDLENSVYVTENDSEKTIENRRPRWTVRGNVDHVEDFDEHDDGRGLEMWADYVDAARGWESYEATLIGFTDEMIDTLAVGEEAV